jgi:hypothetical protein
VQASVDLASKTGRFVSFKNWLGEFRVFARGENGKIMNEPKFHHRGATRYLLLDTTARWITDRPEPKLQKGPPVKMGIWS